MEQEYEGCDLVISRAGATTCAELAAAGRPSVLVPLPLAGAHQSHNAEMMQSRGAARMILQEELTGERLARDGARAHGGAGETARNGGGGPSAGTARRGGK